MDRAELDYRWMSRQPIEGVAFLLNDSVRVVSGRPVAVTMTPAVIGSQTMPFDVTVNATAPSGIASMGDGRFAVLYLMNNHAIVFSP